VGFDFRARKNPQAEQAAEKMPSPFCHSERSEESLFLFLGLNRGEIPRFARNDKKNLLSGVYEACAAGLSSIGHVNMTMDLEKTP
jgi:hypothetical protein